MYHMLAHLQHNYLQVQSTLLHRVLWRISKFHTFYYNYIYVPSVKWSLPVHTIYTCAIYVYTHVLYITPHTTEAMITLSHTAATMPRNPIMTIPNPTATRNALPSRSLPSENVAYSFLVEYIHIPIAIDITPIVCRYARGIQDIVTVLHF